MKLRILSRSGKELVPGGVDLDDGATVADLQAAVHKAKPKLYPARQRFTLPKQEGERRAVVLATGKRLSDYGLADGVELTFKDLGPQIGYSTVFFWEYFGPLVTYSLFYFFPGVFYPGYKRAPVGDQIPPKDTVQTLAECYWVFHYSKRIFETFFVHRFSHGTMPITNLYKNCGYYWGFAALVAYFVNHPLYTPPPHGQAAALFAFAMFCQASNLYCHILLARLRPPGATAYVIPRGYAFDYITCANYTFEVWGWLAFAFATRTLTAFLFIAAGAYQMAVWAKAKHARLRKTFDGVDGREKYPKRWIMLPPFF